MTVNSTRERVTPPHTHSFYQMYLYPRKRKDSRLPQLLLPLAVLSPLKILKWVELSSKSSVGWDSGVFGVFGVPDKEKEKLGYLTTL